MGRLFAEDPGSRPPSRSRAASSSGGIKCSDQAVALNPPVPLASCYPFRLPNMPSKTERGVRRATILSAVAFTVSRS